MLVENMRSCVCMLPLSVAPKDHQGSTLLDHSVRVSHKRFSRVSVVVTLFSLSALTQLWRCVFVDKYSLPFGF